MAGRLDRQPVLVDAHAHLDLLDYPSKAVADALASGVAGIIAVGTDLASSRRAVEFSLKFPQVLACPGIHPHEAASVDRELFTKLRNLAASPRVAAIGETGLDFYRELAPRQAQIDLFRRQIALAREKDLSLMVHTRQAAGPTLEILASDAAGLTVILHCFSLWDQVQECARRGYYMSIAGNVTYKKADELRRAAASIPFHLLLTETDSPYLAPVPHRGKPNRPEYVQFTAAEIARLRGLSEAAFAAQVLANFSRAFNRLKPG